MSQHLTPCDQCPFRRVSARGWLGNSTPTEFLAQAESGIKMPCHTAVDYERPDWEDQVQSAPRCAGHAIYLLNRCKLPADPGLREFLKQVEPDNFEVFSTPTDFVEHHRGDTSRVMMIVLGMDDGS